LCAATPEGGCMAYRYNYIRDVAFANLITKFFGNNGYFVIILSASTAGDTVSESATFLGINEMIIISAMQTTIAQVCHGFHLDVFFDSILIGLFIMAVYDYEE
jgi:hypothetical protein